MFPTIAVCVLCYFSVRVGARLRGRRQRGIAYATLALAVTGFLIVCLVAGPFTREAVYLGVAVLLLGMLCLVKFVLPESRTP